MHFDMFKRYCSQHGGVLAQPETADINNYLKSLTDSKLIY